MTELTSSALAGAVHEAISTCRSAIGALQPAQYAEASVLPGWSRAHVIAHVDGVSRALARQLAYAARGERIGFYDGGMDGRNERIELAAMLAPAKLAERVGAGLDLLAEAIDDIPPGGWQAATSFRGDGTVRDCVLAAWRELLIHATDLGTGTSVAQWPSEFSAHLFDFLAQRVPSRYRLVLQPNGRPPAVIGRGDTGCVVTGMEFDLAAWLAGRQPSGPVRATASADASDLPELGPWPTAVTVSP